jgi:hypothetical protein
MGIGHRTACYSCGQDNPREQDTVVLVRTNTRLHTKTRCRSYLRGAYIG